MDDSDSRVVHALCELAGLALSVWALDHMTDGSVRDALAPTFRWLGRTLHPALTWWSMLGDAAILSGAETIRQAELHKKGEPSA